MDSDGPQTLVEELRATTGIDVAACYQCGKCSAGCPMAGETALRPHLILHRVSRWPRERVLREESIWYCLSCETCSARCPNACDPARVIDALREIGLEEGLADVPRRIAAFHRAFLSQVRLNGRLYEAGLVMEYKLRSGDLVSDVANAPAMLVRGKLPLRPSRIAGIDEVRRIFARCGRES